jgi:sigma-B regulation protein RsbU (phosphoserine phosphatase)
VGGRAPGRGPAPPDRLEDGVPQPDDHRWTAAAAAVVVVLGAADLVLGREVQFMGSLVIAPFLAAAMNSPRTALAVGLFALLVGVFLVSVNDVGRTESILRVVVLSAGTGLAVWLSARRERRERDLATMTRVAEVAQRCVLTAVPPRLGDFAFASRYPSASPVALIGGDFYEVVDCDNGLVRAVVGDVRGKGLDAVRLAALVLGSFREAAQTLERLDGVASLMDRRLRRHLDAEDFVTAVFAEFRPSGRLTLVNCGHHPPLLLRDSATELLTPRTTTTPLGLDPIPNPEETTMLPGDRLLLYTDGLVEARSRSGRMIALEHLAKTLGQPNLDQALGDLVSALESLVVGPLEDDMALVLAEYCGADATTDQPVRDERMSSITAE